jgi:hypothetical protein
MTSDTVDFLMSQKDGANYVVLYQMLCLKTVNNHGVMARQIGEMLIPYEIDKIQRDCKWFSIDTVRIALELYKKLGLIFENNDGFLALSDFDRMIGSQTYGAEKKELQKSKGGTRVENFPPDKEIKRLRDKENREEDININKDNDKSAKKRRVFTAPKYEEVLEYAKEKGREDIAKEFYDYFTVGEWVDSQGNKVRNWKQKFLTWCGKNAKKTDDKPAKPRYGTFDAKQAMEDALKRNFFDED